MEQISRWLGHDADAAKWRERAEKRKQIITRYLWDEAAGLFFDYDVPASRRSSYRYATTLIRSGRGWPPQSRRGEWFRICRLLKRPGDWP